MQPWLQRLLVSYSTLAKTGLYDDRDAHFASPVAHGGPSPPPYHKRPKYPIYDWHDIEVKMKLYKAQSAGDVALLKCLDRANLTCTPAVNTHGDALISAMRSQRKPQMLRLLEATRAGRRHCEAGKPSEPCTKGCWSGEAYGFHGKPLKNHFLVTHFYRALAA